MIRGKTRSILEFSALSLLAGLPSACILAYYPPAWNFMDSCMLLYYSLGTIPNQAPLYPIIIHFLGKFFGINDFMLYLLLGIQHSVWVVSILYLLYPFKNTGAKFLFVPLLFLCCPSIFLIINGLYSEAVFFPALLFLIGSFFRFILFRKKTDFVLYHLFLFLVILSRHTGAIFCAVLPLYFLVRWAAGRFRETRRMVLLSGLGIASGLLVLSADILATRAIVEADGRRYEPLIGRFGADILHGLPWDRMEPAERDALLKRMKDRTDDPLLKKTFDIILFENGNDLWRSAHDEIQRRLSSGSYPVNDPSRTPDYYMNRAYFIFMTTPNKYFIKRAANVLYSSVKEKHYETIIYNCMRGIEMMKNHPMFQPISKNINLLSFEPNDYERYMESTWLYVYDSCLFTAMILFMAMLAKNRRAATPEAVFGALTLFSILILYLLAISLVTSMVSRYILPAYLLAFSATLLAASSPRPGPENPGGA